MDKFNDIWKNRFNEGDMPIGDWNTPDEELWGNIMAEAVPKKDNKKGLFWLLGAVLLGLLLFYFLMFKNGQGVSADLSKKETTTEASNLSTVLNETSKSNGQKTQELQPLVPPQSEIAEEVLATKEAKAKHTELKLTSQNTFATSKGAGNLNTDIPVERNKPTNEEATTIYEELSKEESEKNQLVEKVYPKIIEKKVQRTEALDDLSRLRLPFSISNSTEEAIPLPANAKIKLDVPNNPGRLIWGVHAGALIWQHKISDSYQSDLAPFDFNYSNDIGYFVALETDFSINKFLDVFAGIQYERINTTSGHNSELAYDVNAEQNDSSNDYALNLATPYGLSAASFRFERNADLGQEEVELLVDFKSSHVIQNLSLPIGLRLFPKGKNNRWTPSISIGAGVNYLMSISNNIQSIDTHHDAIQYRTSGASEFQSPAISKWYLDARLGLGLGYDITNKLQIDFNYNWSRGLNPIFQQDSYTTRIDRHYLSLGILNLF